MSRWGGRFAPNQENELKRLVKEPVQTWKREWVQPDPNKPFKVLKYVKTGRSIDFATQAALEADKVEPEQDDEPEVAQEEEGDQEQEGEQEDEDRDDEDEEMAKEGDASASAPASGTAPASALPAHMQAEAAAAAASASSSTVASSSASANPSTTASTDSNASSNTSASSSSEPSPTASQLDAALVNAAAGIPAVAAASLAAPTATAAATGSEVVGGGGVQVASELNPPPDGVTPAAQIAPPPVSITNLDTPAAGGGGGDGNGGASSTVPTRQEVRSVGGVATEVLVQAFTDRILVLVTQLGRVGCLIQATTSAPAHYVPASALTSRPLFGDGDDFNFDGPAEAGNMPVSAYLQPPTTQSGATLPNPLPNTALLTLFGTPPASQDTLFSLYVSQIAAIVHARAGRLPGQSQAGAGRDTARLAGLDGVALPQQEPDPRPVVVGLALKRLAASGVSEAAEQGDSEDEVDVLDAGERERFLEVMDMVLACRVW